MRSLGDKSYKYPEYSTNFYNDSIVPISVFGTVKYNKKLEIK